MTSVTIPRDSKPKTNWSKHIQLSTLCKFDMTRLAGLDTNG